MSRKVILPTGPTTPGAIAGLVGGRLGKAAPIAGVLANQDRVLWAGRRVVGHVGIYGAGEWQVPSTDPATQPSQTHPLADVERRAGHWKVRVTPGYQLFAAVLAQPSGANQKAVGGGAYDVADIASGGYVKIEVLYDNGGLTDTVTQLVTPPISTEDYYGEATDSAWNSVHGPVFVDLRVQESLESVAVAEHWSEHDVEATIIVAYVGSVRVMEVVIYEVPVGYVRDWTDAEYVGHAYTNGDGLGLDSYPSDYPIQRREEATPDPTGGSLQALAVQITQQSILGPVLCSWSPWDEVDVGVDETDPAGWQVTSFTAFIDLHAGVASYDEANPGWSASSGSNARLFNLAGDLLELRDDDGVVPVTVRLYASNTGGAGLPAEVIIQTSASSIVQGRVTSIAHNWISLRGDLRCGIGAQDFSSIQILGQVAALGLTLDVKGFVIEYDEQRGAT